MISFLVKLANLLDNRGQYKMAREVDDLIEKLAQQAFSPEQLVQRYQDAERANQAAAEEWRTAQQAWQAQPWKDELLAQRDEARKRYDATWAARDEAKKEMDANGAKLSPSAPAAAPAVGVAAKEPAAPKAKPPTGNSLVAKIQKAIGVTPSGKWTPETNSAFIKYMNEKWPLAMDNNRFVGVVMDEQGNRSGNTLSDAWDLIGKGQVATRRRSEMYGDKLPQKLPAEEPAEGAASREPAKAPAAPQVWKSRFFQITPAAQKALQELEKNFPGTAQKEIDQLDYEKQNGVAGKNMDQETFEEILGQRAIPAKV